jgi:GntR family transcriptional regulator
MPMNAKLAVPDHVRVEQQLVNDMQAGVLAPGARLPSEANLVDRFNVNTSTVRQAIQNLLERGLVEIRPDRRICVVQPKITQELVELTGFVEDMKALGMEATARVIDKKIVAADETVARQLRLRKGDPVVRLQRVRIGDGIPLSFDETFLLRSVGEKIMNDNLVTTQVFTLLEEKYNTPLLEAQYTMEAVPAPRAVAKALEIRANSPVFMIERTSYSVDRRPVDYEKLYYRADHIRFTTRLPRRIPPDDERPLAPEAHE